MRGTLHLVPAEDLPWLLRLTAVRVVEATARRRAELGLDSGELDRAREHAESALQGGARLRRQELLHVWDRAGLATTGQRGYHLIAHLAQTGVLCFGPHVDSEPAIVLVDDWVRHPRRLDRDEALSELATRYFRGHGPATVKDFGRWTNLRAADVRAAVALARPHLESVTFEGVEHLMDPQTPAVRAACRHRVLGTFLLPGFDEFVLGYGDRTAVLDPEFADRIVPGGNGVFRGTVVHAGRIVGTWRHAGRGARRTVDATPFTTFPPKVAAGIQEAYAALP